MPRERTQLNLNFGRYAELLLRVRRHCESEGIGLAEFTAHLYENYFQNKPNEKTGVQICLTEIRELEFGFYNHKSTIEPNIKYIERRLTTIEEELKKLGIEIVAEDLEPVSLDSQEAPMPIPMPIPAKKSER